LEVVEGWARFASPIPQPTLTTEAGEDFGRQLHTSKPQYISASRRTDIPAFFAGDFFAAWRAGAVTYDGGYGRSYTVSLRPDAVLGYIFWSKDFAPFIADPNFRPLIQTNNAVFGFTINDCPELEPRVARLEERLATLGRLCDAVGPERVVWRFDPLCKFVDARGATTLNWRPFLEILPMVARLGVKECYFSFMTAYNKLKSRGVKFLPFTIEEQTSIVAEMVGAAAAAGLTLANCCNPEVLDLNPAVRQAHCVSDDLLRRTDRFGVHPGLKEKPTRPGCGCFESRDIGSYAQKCPHGCHYCYANPATLD